MRVNDAQFVVPNRFCHLQWFFLLLTVTRLVTMSKFYSKEKVIGSGTFGKVWLVKSKGANNHFVMKEVDLVSMNTTETQQALTEVTVLSRCKHRNIIQYKDAIIDHKIGVLSIIMEYADGGDLFTAIVKQRGVPFKEHTVITWFTQICLALQYIHHKKILHRDLKTRNIFLTCEKEIKIGDFGIARCLGNTDELAVTAIGTPYYLSPEICDRKPYNHKSDIWALGCILFEMATLSHPFEAYNFSHLLSLIVTGKRKQLPSHCSSLLRDLVEKLLDLNSDTRPSADEILALPALQPYLSEMWRTQNTKMLHQKLNGRRFSLNTVGSETINFSDLRRASTSSIETRGTRTRFGYKPKGKSFQGSKVSTSTRSHLLKIYKFSPKRSTLKKDSFLTYRVLKPVTFKDKLTNIMRKSLKISRSDSRKSQRSNDSRVNQSQTLQKHLSDTTEYGLNIFTHKAQTSTPRRMDVPNFQVDDSLVEDVFEDRSSTRTIHTECKHSQCQQCMIDILWRNRIRGRVRGASVKSNERSSLVRKLQVVFGNDFLDTVYSALLTNWDNGESSDLPVDIRGFTDSMSYSQLQHLPLLMQLIQLDLVPKG